VTHPPSITSPLNLAAALQARPRAGFDFVPFLDFIFLALFVALTASSFIQSPGATLNLVRSQPIQQNPLGPVTVLTIDRNELLFLGGLKIPPAGLRAALRDEAARSGERARSLVIKADRELNLEELFRFLELAREAGFEQVHLAAEHMERDQTAR
jgi:biopolymer transport protein ExbD